jgi:hypothetical protein
MRVAGRVLPFAWLIAIGAMGLHLLRADTAWFAWYHGLLSAIVALGAILTAIGRIPVRARLAIAMTVLFGGGVLLAMHLGGAWPFGLDPFKNPRYVAFLVAANAVPFVGLAFRQMWARWIGIAYGVFGALSAALNLLWVVTWANETTWLLALGTFAYGLLAWNLGTPAVRDAFVAKDRHGSLWGSVDPVMRAVRPALVANIGAIAMLLVYGWLQPFVASVGPFAFALAAWLGLGAALTIARRAAGPLVLALGGVGLVAITVVTAALTDPQTRLYISPYYAAFWLPAAVLGLRAGIVLARRARA